MFSNLSKHCQQSYIGFTCTLYSKYENVCFWGLESFFNALWRWTLEEIMFNLKKKYPLNSKFNISSKKCYHFYRYFFSFKDYIPLTLFWLKVGWLKKTFNFCMIKCFQLSECKRTRSELTVGAHSKIFWSVSMAALNSRLWILFRDLNPSKAGWAYFGILSIFTRDWK